MSKLTTEDCKNFLVAYFKKNNVFTSINDWKRTRKYKLNNLWHRDFEHLKLGVITLKEANGILEVVSNIVSNKDVTHKKQKKPSMASLYQGMCEESGDKLIGGSVEATIKSLLYSPNDEYELISGGEDDVDDDETPVTGYYFHSEGRDYTLLVYADNSWISSSD